MKRLFAFILILCLLFSLAACTAAPTAKPDAEKPGTEAPAGTASPATAAAGSGAAPHDDSSGSGEPGGLLEVPADGGDLSFYYAGKGSEGGGSAFGESAASPGSAETGKSGDEAEPGASGDDPEPDDPSVLPSPPADPGEALKLTAAEWNDNENWPFFTNLVNGERIRFPSFGLDPRNRIEVKVSNEAMLGQANETVRLLDAEGRVLWTAHTDRNGTAYVFFSEGQTPDRVVCGEASTPVNVPESGSDPQGQTTMKRLDSVVLEGSGAAPAQTNLQVMFIVDTTGSMSDEIAYLQKDFSAIAERVGNDGVTWSVNFYRDEGDDYVTRTNGFSSDVAEIQAKINAEYADGGGDTPEAVAEILTECLTENGEWRDDAVKLAFLIFDAPPHDGKEAALQAAVKAAAEKGVRVIPVVASNAERDTELFGRALAILTNGTYVFLTDDSGVGESHLEPIVGDYTVELLQDLIVKIIERYRP